MNTTVNTIVTELLFFSCNRRLNPIELLLVYFGTVHVSLRSTFMQFLLLLLMLVFLFFLVFLPVLIHFRLLQVYVVQS